MKLDERQFAFMIQKLMICYNQFVSAESLANTITAWFEKLKDQENHIVKLVIERWDSEKMPNAGQILNICKKISKDRIENIPLHPDELVCRYKDYMHDFEGEESDISKWLCSNNSQMWPIDKERIDYCIRNREDKKIICYWHQRVINEKAKRYMEGRIYSFYWDEWMMKNFENDKNFITWYSVNKLNERIKK